jgi:hypothetical protein
MWFSTSPRGAASMVPDKGSGDLFDFFLYGRNKSGDQTYINLAATVHGKYETRFLAVLLRYDGGYNGQEQSALVRDLLCEFPLYLPLFAGPDDIMEQLGFKVDRYTATTQRTDDFGDTYYPDDRVTYSKNGVRISELP